MSNKGVLYWCHKAWYCHALMIVTYIDFITDVVESAK